MITNVTVYRIRAEATPNVSTLREASSAPVLTDTNSESPVVIAQILTSVAIDWEFVATASATISRARSSAFVVTVTRSHQAVIRASTSMNVSATQISATTERASIRWAPTSATVMPASNWALTTIAQVFFFF